MLIFRNLFAHCFRIFFGVAAAALVSAPLAQARAYIMQPGSQPQAETMITPMLGVSAWYGFEGGVKVGWRLANPGFVPMINNTVYIEASAFAAESGHIFLAPLLLWNFHLHPKWSVFGEAGAELGAHVAGRKERDHDAAGLRSPGSPSGIDLATGGIWHFQPDMSMRLEFDLAHQAPRIGLQIPL